jgi:hypothetical protein
MGIRNVESKKEEKEDLLGRQQGRGTSARIERGRAFKARGGDHNLGWVGRNGRPARNRSPEVLKMRLRADRL